MYGDKCTAKKAPKRAAIHDKGNTQTVEEKTDETKGHAENASDQQVKKATSVRMEYNEIRSHGFNEKSITSTTLPLLNTSPAADTHYKQQQQTQQCHHKLICPNKLPRLPVCQLMCELKLAEVA